MKKAYSYLRISSEKQTRGGGIERQMEASRAYAEQNGYQLVETLQDIGVSAYKGKNASEGALGLFMDAIDTGEVASGSVLIVESLDRLSRQDPMSAFTQFSAIISKGVTIVTLVDGAVYSPESVKEDVSKLFMSLGSMMRAHDESKTKSVRQTSAWKKKRTSGKVMTGRCPAWLEVVDGEFRVKDGSQRIIDFIFDSSINGRGAFSIATTMNKDLDAYPTLTGGKGWSAAYVMKILSNRHVLGELQPYSSVNGKREPVGEPLKDYFPAVVSEEKYLLAQAGLASRRNSGSGRKGKNNTNLFSHIVKCGRCGAAMVYRTKAKGKGRDMLRCNNSYLKNGCDAPGWAYVEFEEAFVRFVNEVDFTEVFGGNGAGKRIAALEKEKIVVAQKFVEIEKKIDTIVDRMMNPELSDNLISRFADEEKTHQEKLHQLRMRQEEIRNEVTILSNKSTNETKKEFQDTYAKIREGDGDMRFHLTDVIKRIVKRIDCYTYKKLPYEDLIDREFIVTFRNGESRIAYCNGSVSLVSAESVALKKQFENKS